MLIDFLVTIFMGACGAGFVLIVNHLGGKLAGFRLPKWAMPAAVGAAMIAYSIWNEYNWYPRTLAELPATVVVAVAPEEKVFYRPWTYLFPLVTRFIAVDRAPAAGTQVFATKAYVVTRWGPTQAVPVAFDCGRGVRADLVEGAKLNEDGSLTGADWTAGGGDDSLVRAACMGG